MPGDHQGTGDFRQVGDEVYRRRVFPINFIDFYPEPILIKDG